MTDESVNVPCPECNGTGKLRAHSSPETLIAELQAPDAFDVWWQQEIHDNGGVAIGADYRHWARRGFDAAIDNVTRSMK